MLREAFATHSGGGNNGGGGGTKKNSVPRNLTNAKRASSSVPRNIKTVAKSPKGK